MYLHLFFSVIFCIYLYILISQCARNRIAWKTISEVIVQKLEEDEEATRHQAAIKRTKKRRLENNIILIPPKRRTILVIRRREFTMDVTNEDEIRTRMLEIRTAAEEETHEEPIEEAVPMEID